MVNAEEALRDYVTEAEKDNEAIIPPSAAEFPKSLERMIK